MDNGEVKDPRAEAFLDDLEIVCRKHGLSIGHEDGHGAFQIWEFNESDIRWLRDAQYEFEPYRSLSERDRRAWLNKMDLANEEWRQALADKARERFPELFDVE
jgi:hypothetical protein